MNQSYTETVATAVQVVRVQGFRAAGKMFQPMILREVRAILYEDETLSKTDGQKKDVAEYMQCLQDDQIDMVNLWERQLDQLTLPPPVAHAGPQEPEPEPAPALANAGPRRGTHGPARSATPRRSQKRKDI